MKPGRLELGSSPCDGAQTVLTWLRKDAAEGQRPLSAVLASAPSARYRGFTSRGLHERPQGRIRERRHGYLHPGPFLRIKMAIIAVHAIATFAAHNPAAADLVHARASQRA